MAPQDSKIAMEILQSVNNRTQSLRKILCMVISDIVINTLLGRVALDPAGMHCPAGEDAFVLTGNKQNKFCLFVCFFITLRVRSAVRSTGAYFEHAFRCDFDAVCSVFSEWIVVDGH